jgi:Lrp/AsnC family transcriptional regulator, leucine-responsive regulatory protein
VADEIVVIDQIDREILAVLRRDARIGWGELGARVSLSPNAAADRVRKLVRQGVIRRFTVDIDRARLGRTLDAVIDVRVAPGAEATRRFREGVLSCEEMVWFAHITGRADFQVQVSCAGTVGLNELLTRFRDEFGAVETQTTVVLEQVG